MCHFLSNILAKITKFNIHCKGLENTHIPGGAKLIQHPRKDSAVLLIGIYPTDTYVQNDICTCHLYTCTCSHVLWQ